MKTINFSKSEKQLICAVFNKHMNNTPFNYSFESILEKNVHAKYIRAALIEERSSEKNSNLKNQKIQSILEKIYTL